MKVAICSKDFEKVSGHAGQAKRWLLYEVDELQQVTFISNIELEKAQTFHHFKDDSPHPLDGIEVLITTSTGESFITRMKRRGVNVALTSESDPFIAIKDYLAKQLKPPKPRPIMSMICKLRDRLSQHRDE